MANKSTDLCDDNMTYIAESQYIFLSRKKHECDQDVINLAQLSCDQDVINLARLSSLDK